MKKKGSVVCPSSLFIQYRLILSSVSTESHGKPVRSGLYEDHRLVTDDFLFLRDPLLIRSFFTNKERKRFTLFVFTLTHDIR